MTPIRHRAAVLGSPIHHSRSPLIHNAGYRALGLTDWEYLRIETRADDVRRTVEESDASFAGFSVTMPGKFEALALADDASERARVIGAANTLVRTGDGWYADNTDGVGVLGCLDELLGAVGITSAVVVGAGGTARPALWALAERGCRDVTIVNRSDREAELSELLETCGITAQFVDFDADLATASRQADVVISTVPAAAVKGHERDLGHAPILDVIYDPWPTPLTVHAAANGYRTVGGHAMLVHQACPQFEAFTGRKAPYPQMRSALEEDLGI
ncbi:shikimate dehydrogenase [Corynebacterium uterequi]|uniref:shikimate dehydrogenase (NADP(+)) n=1 Tax=Corynebacterium uterequi TaxID=1072256 RepID=A0A0G3HD48_9CORY|nr:shikimate dehydrogenase [Corynebacterium uterequi]AKK11209.1 shikimate-5-dehydrogenase, fungal AROM-type [Corynebacterium uterequi]